jgi:hypothetical protein
MQILLYIFAAVILFITTGILGRLMFDHKDTLFNYSTFHSFSEEKASLSGNFVLKTFFPCVFIVGLSWLLQIFKLEHLTSNIWLVVFFYWIIRMIWILVIFNRASLTNFAYEAVSFIVSIASAFFVYDIFIDYCIKNDISVFLSRDELRSGVAFALLLYAINIIWKVLNANGLFSRKNIYRDSIILRDLQIRTVRLVSRYGSFVRETLMELLDESQFSSKEYLATKLLFSIMIIEDRNRPYLVRAMENLLHKTFMRDKLMSVGIMQVKSISNLNDEQSIREAIKIILSVIEEEPNNPNYYVTEDSAIVSAVCERYNSSYEYLEEVEFIQQEIGEWLDLAQG